MDAAHSEVQSLVSRVEKLERQNRRFKQLGVAALAIPALLLVMGQARPSKKVVDANEFVLRDDGGNIRARLFMTPNIGQGKPEGALALYDEKGRPSASLSDTELAFPQFHSSFGSSLFLGLPTSGGVTVGPSGVVVAGSQGAVTRLGSTDIHVLDEGFLTVMTREGLSVTDPQGFEATLGVADTVTPRTGETQKTSAASLTLYDKDKHLIWKAP